MPVQTPYSSLSALVIDDMSAQQTTLRGQLGMLGITKVDVVGTPDEAIRQLRAKPYGLVLCDYHLNQKSDGQQLFEFARENDLMAADGLFFMVTAESAYKSVAAASEINPDAYLLKPITAADIEDRLKFCIERRNALTPVHQRLARDDLAGAIVECDRIIARQDRWQMQAWQIKGSSLLALGRHQEARQTYHAVLDQKPQIMWARLGLARAHKAGNQLEEAKMIVSDILNSRSGDRNVGAFDVMAEVLEAQGDAEGALWVLKDAAVAVPSARRERLVAESAYRVGDLHTARESFAKVLKATRGAMTAQPQDALGMAQTQIDAGDAAGALATLDEHARGLRHHPVVEGTALAVRAQALAGTGQTAAAEATLAKARMTMRKPKADFATVALAKAEMSAGQLENGLRLLGTAVSADHENPRIKQLVSQALRTAGHEDKIQQVVESAAADLNNRVAEAKKLFRDSRLDDALQAIEQALLDYPENTGVLLQAAQMNCMALRLQQKPNPLVIDRVRLYLTRLEKLMPGNDRVTQMQRYFRETQDTLKPANAAAAA